MNARSVRARSFVGNWLSPEQPHAVTPARTQRAGQKYRNQKCNGYDSKREAIRAAELQLMEKLGEIRELRYQVEYELIPKQQGERAVKYKADFVYRDKSGNEVVEDSKGFKTRDYILKRKLMLWVHGVKVREV